VREGHGKTMKKIGRGKGDREGIIKSEKLFRQ